MYVYFIIKSNQTLNNTNINIQDIILDYYHTTNIIYIYKLTIWCQEALHQQTFRMPPKIASLRDYDKGDRADDEDDEKG